MPIVGVMRAKLLIPTESRMFSCHLVTVGRGCAPPVSGVSLIFSPPASSNPPSVANMGFTKNLFAETLAHIIALKQSGFTTKKLFEQVSMYS